MFAEEIKNVEPLRNRVAEAANQWIELKKAKNDPYRYISNDRIAYSRERLVNALVLYRNQLSKIYDIMNERGLVDFEWTIIANGDSGNLSEAKARRDNQPRIV